eukprot:95905_1
MSASDIVIGWITENGEYILSNRYTNPNSFGNPQLFDDQSGIKKIDGWYNEINGTSMTYLHFEKEMFPDFDERNVNIKIGTTQIIYAWRDGKLTANGNPSKHCDQCRGPQSINLLQGEQDNDVILPDDSNYVDVTVNQYHLPSDDTIYHCSLHQLPQFDDTQHIIRFGPKIDPPQHEGLVHHLLMYDCPQIYINQTQVGKGWLCDEMEENMAPIQCRGGGLLAAWAIGGGNFDFPDNVGLEMG